MRLQSGFFNTYLILKSCWVVLLFNLIGYFMLVAFNQGQDVLRTLGFDAGDYHNRRHTVMVCILLVYWGWQNYRSARIITHSKAFHFSEFYRSYALRTLVVIPRLFALLPFLIMAGGTFKANQGMSGLVMVYLMLGLGLFLFILYRRNLIVYLMSKQLHVRFLLDYIPVKNDSYPAAFIISKQKWWIVQRIVILISTFCLILFFPVSFSTFVGSCGIVILAFSNWLIFFTLLSLFERRLKIPFLFILFICWLAFSFFNNNHELRVLESNLPDERPFLDTYIQDWLTHRKASADTVQVNLVACEGGGIRAAYWTNEVLTELVQRDTGFLDQVLAFSAVSGGALGAVTFNLANKHFNKVQDAREYTRRFLRKDFLSPVMAYAMFPDALQRILPFPVPAFDRATILEKTWEQGWLQTGKPGKDLFNEGFLGSGMNGQKGKGPLIFLNATHIETGKRILVSPVKFGDPQFFQTNDILQTTGKDLRLSSSVLLSARFPYVTPAALVRDRNNQIWGHAGDGGYYENLGISTLLDVYNRLRALSVRLRIPLKVQFIFIRNTKDFTKTTPLKSMYELMAPIEGYLNVWYKSGGYNLNLIKNISFSKNDRILNFALPRFENDIIPLGWSLSRQATQYINGQVKQVVELELGKPGPSDELQE